MSADRDQELLSLLKAICKIPAPTFAEAGRARFISEVLVEGGLAPECDEVGNVVAEIPGGEGPRVLVAAHLDTVFEGDSAVAVEERDGRLYAPGIGDNSAGLAVLSRFVTARGDPRPRLIYAATVGEEGLGDLYGMRHLMTTRRHDFDAMVAVDGHLGTIVDRGVGSRRYRARFKAKGGHSWGDFPSPSAIHAAGEAIAGLARMKLPANARSSYNVGLIAGGTSVNAIAQEAEFLLDLRSLESAALEQLEDDALARIKHAARVAEVEVTLELVGNRPVGTVANEPLVEAAEEALRFVGITPRLAASSTDANAAMAASLPAITFGVYRGGDAHRLSEWLEPASLSLGYRALARLMANLSRL